MHFLRNKRQHFTRDIVLVLSLLSAAVLGSVTYFAFRADKDISQNYIDAATASAVRQFQTMVASMTRSLELAGDWIATGKMSPADANALNGLLSPMLKRDPMLSGISVADPQGNSYYVTTHETGWKTRMVREADGRHQAVLRYWSADRQPLAEETRLSSYDPRSRPWFAPALAQNGVFLTRPYIFFDRQVVGITASLARKVGAGSDLLVLAFDIFDRFLV